MRLNFTLGKVLASLFAISILPQLHAQIAITEVNSTEANSGYPDWFELSNLGTNDVDLTDYSWNDDHYVIASSDSTALNGVTIHAGEAIILVQSNATINSADAFRQWWGTANVGSSVQVILYPPADPGLGSGGDSVCLRSPDAVNNSDLVDRVDIGTSIAGRSFNYNTNNGTFNRYSTNGVNGAFNAATVLSSTNDVGSPSFAPSPAAPVITKHPAPANRTVPAGTSVTYSVAGYGLPKPKFEWLFNGSPLDTNALGAAIFNTITNNQSVSTLTIASAQTGNTGTYSVRAGNVVQTVNSSNASLTITTGPVVPTITTPPTGIEAYIGQSVTLSASVFGSPTPALQWQFNGTNFAGQTDSQLQLSLSDTNQTGLYTLVATNASGTNSASAFVNVTLKPNLRITEVMSAENDAGKSNQREDWWELSNLGDFSVHLLGYRFDDNSFSLAAAYTITTNVTIAPGESVVLVENLTPAQFHTWWGTNLPANVQIISYSGSQLSFSSGGDSLEVWNAAANNEGDYVDAVSFASATAGDSFGFDPATQTFGDLSVAGVNGAFTAAIGGDIGSPGTIVNLPQITATAQTGEGFSLTWISQPNYNYEVQYKDNLAQTNWLMLTNLTAGINRFTFTDSATNSQRFYRVVLHK